MSEGEVGPTQFIGKLTEAITRIVLSNELQTPNPMRSAHQSKQFTA